MLFGLCLFAHQALGSTLAENALPDSILDSASQTRLNEKGEPYNGTVRNYLGDGFITIPYVNGIIKGTMLLEYDDGRTYVIEFKDGVLNGPFKTYYPNGTLSGEVVYKNNKCTSSERQYYESGKLHFERDCTEGEFSGYLREYYESGQLAAKIPVKQGKANGIAYHYDERGRLRAEIEYVDSKRQGVGTVYYPNGAIMAEFTFVDNVENGPVVEYYENGQAYKEYSMVNGIIEGPTKEYYESGNLYATSTFKDGKSQNVQFYYDEQSPIRGYLQVGLAAFVLAFGLTWLFFRLRRKS